MRSGFHIASALIGATILCGGCTKTTVQKIARYQLGDEPTTELVRKTGVYAVKYVSGSSSQSHKIDASERLMDKGERLGFATDEHGKIVGIAGEQRIPIYDLPPDAQSVVWYHKSKQQTQFGREMEKAGQTAGEIGTVAAVGTLAGVAIIGGAMLDNQDDCACSNSVNNQPPRHKHHHHR